MHELECKRLLKYHGLLLTIAHESSPLHISECLTDFYGFLLIRFLVKMLRLGVNVKYFTNIRFFKVKSLPERE